MLAGIIGSILPVVPGTPLIFLAALGYAVVDDFEGVGWKTLAVLGGIALFSQAVDWLASAYGARRYQASRWGILAGIIGGILGAFFWGLVGILLGVFLGAFLAEWTLAGKCTRVALKIGVGSLLGFLSGTLMKFILALIMVAIFLYAALM